VAPKEPRLIEAPHFSVLRKGGVYVSLISPTLELTGRIGPPLGLAVSGLWMGLARLYWLARGKHHRWVYFRPSADRLAEMAQWVCEGAFTPIIGHRFPLKQVADAHRVVESGPAHGKVLLTMDPR
jgi:NADPH:quinone reductase-like Zn-dependent oxidoreductase